MVLSSKLMIYLAFKTMAFPYTFVYFAAATLCNVALLVASKDQSSIRKITVASVHMTSKVVKGILTKVRYLYL